MQEELLSKKELLELTGISYGQLYRWKRQKLIPETWFFKQSAFTGQETFFPKEKILKRINMIIELKDQYSLEELAAFLSPESTGKLFEEDELLNLPELDSNITSKFKEILGKDHFAFKELLFINVLSDLRRQMALSDAEITDMAESIQEWLPKLNTTSYQMIVGRKNAQLFGLLLQQNSSFYLDHHTSEFRVFDLDEFSKELKLKLNQVLEET